MNIKGANTEPFYRFVRAHEDLGASIKLAYGALYAISQDEKTMASSGKSSFIALPTGGEPWGKNTRWRSVKARIPKVRKLISEMGLVLAASVFEDFLTNVLSDHSRFSDFAQKKKSPWLPMKKKAKIASGYDRSLTRFNGTSSQSNTCCLSTIILLSSGTVSSIVRVVRVRH